MALAYIAKISPEGRVELPSEARARWGADRVVVVDMGDRVVMRPLPDDPIRDVQEKYRGLLPSTDEMRREAREVEAEREERLYGKS